MDDNNTIDWKRYFDAIYCIHYLPFTNRVDRITSELKRVGILDSGVFHWKYTFDSPFYVNLINSDISLFHETLRNPSMMKCTLSHYSIYKEALGLNFGKILIIEDDIVFLKDISLISSILESTPNGYDVVQYDYFPFSRQHYDFYTKTMRINEHFAGFYSHMSSGALYSINEKAMKFVVNRQEMSLHAGDTAWHAEEKDDGIMRCFSIKNVGYQKQYNDSYTNRKYGTGMMESFYRFCELNEDDYS